jgi:hypothetical protein
MPRSVAGCATYPEYLLDDVGHDPERKSPSQRVWGVCEESSEEGAVEATAVSAEFGESADQFGRSSPAIDAASAVAMGPATVVFELGYDDAVELFLCGLGGCGLPGSHHPDCLPGGTTQKQHNPSMVCATGAATSCRDLAAVGPSGIAGRPRVCRRQVAEIPATDAEVALPDSD